MKLRSNLMLLLLAVVPALQAGFGVDTPVKTLQGYINIQVLQKSDQVVSWSNDLVGAHAVTKTRRSGVIKVVQIKLPNSTLICDLKQSFFLPFQNKWQVASELQPGMALLSYQGELVQVLDVQVLSKSARIFSLEVDQAHTYFVSRDEVLVHNGIPVLIGFAWVFGEKAIEFAGANLMIGIIGWLYDRNSNSVKTKIDTSHLDEAMHNVFADKAPGKPTKVEGYVPPKKWDGKKVKHPETGQYGYPDKGGNVWVPTGPTGHGGAHWDVVDPWGNRVDNVYPGGHSRPGN